MLLCFFSYIVILQGCLRDCSNILLRGLIMTENVTAVILAAGKGTRMKSDLPKVLHPLVGRTLVMHVLQAVQEAGIREEIIVIGYGAEQVKESLGDDRRYAYQEQQLGTGHAVMAAMDGLPEDTKEIIVLCGDAPLITAATITNLLTAHRKNGAAATVLTAVLEDPAGYGRIIRGEEGSVLRIAEEKDASAREKLLKEVNTGTYCFNLEKLSRALESIKPTNAQGEYYLTDVLEFFSTTGERIDAVKAENSQETLGINNRLQLAEAGKIMRRRINEHWMLEGVGIIDPERTYIDAEVIISADTLLEPGTMLKGKTIIGGGCSLGPDTVIEDSVLEDNVTVLKSVIISSRVGNGCRIGPFSYLRPETQLGQGAKVGDFVELKKTTIGSGSKVPHLTYLGDCTVGSGVNVGAGTITCNYDGQKKWPSVIEDDAFIGSNTNLVAPVKVGRGAVIGAGSTITEDVPAGGLGIARSRQANISGWSKKENNK